MEIIQYLQSKQYTIFILSSGDTSDALKLEQANCIVMDLGVLVSNPLALVRYIYRLTHFINKIKPVQIFTFTIRPNIFGNLVGKWCNYPVVSNITGTGPLFESKSILYKIVKGLYSFSLKSAKVVFFQNEADQNQFIKHNFVSKSQAKLLPGSGVDTQFFNEIKLEKQDTSFRFLMISRLIYDKGIQEYIDAAKIVKQEFPQVICQLLGPFWTQNVKTNTVSQQDIDLWEANGWIEYLGYTYDVRPYIAISDCVVLPSYREGCANVLMQGASMSKPLIASDVVGCNNLVDHKITGFLCKPKSAISLATVMVDMINSSEEKRYTMGQLGRQKMINNYQKQIVLDAYLSSLNG